MKARGPKSRCWKGRVLLSEGSRRILPCLFLAFGGFQQFLVCTCVTPISFASIFTWPSPLCVYVSPLLIETAVLRPTLLQYKLILTNYICKESSSKEGTFIGTWGQGFNIFFSGDTIQPIT